MCNFPTIKDAADVVVASMLSDIQHKAKRDKSDAPTKDPTAAEAPLDSPAGAGAGAKTSLDARATLVMEAATMRTVQEIFFMSMVGK
ncbi:hypothetical protein ACOSQ4_017371 [Xanthoceras sorbifolium]